MCNLSVYTLLKVVGYYDLSVLPMSVMGFQKKSLHRGWVGGVSSIQFFWLDFWNCFNFTKPLSLDTLIKAYLLVITDDVEISDLIPEGELTTEMYKLISYIVHATMRIECDR